MFRLIYLLAALTALAGFATAAPPSVSLTTATLVDSTLTLVGTGFGANTLEYEILNPATFAVGTEMLPNGVEGNFGQGWLGGVSISDGNPPCKARIIGTGGYTGNHVLLAEVFGNGHFTNGFQYQATEDGRSRFGSVYVSWYQLMSSPTIKPYCTTLYAECNATSAQAKWFRVSNTTAFGNSGSDAEGEHYFTYSFNPNNLGLNLIDLQWGANDEGRGCCISYCTAGEGYGTPIGHCKWYGFPAPYTGFWSNMHSEQNRNGSAGYARSLQAINPINRWVRYEVMLKASSDLGVRDGSFRVRVFSAGLTPVDWFHDGDLVTHVVTDSLKYDTGETTVVDTWDNVWDRITFNAYWSKRGDRVKYYFDDIFMSFNNGPARVVLGDADTWDACRTFNDLQASAWSSTGITANFKIGGVVKIETYNPVYVYVVSASGVVNPIGKAVTTTIVNPPRQYEYPDSPPIEGGGGR